MREDKNKLLQLYSSYPHLLEIYKKFIDEDLPDGYTTKESIHFTLEEMRSEMVKYNKLLDSYRDTNFFEIFPQYRKYENTNV